MELIAHKLAVPKGTPEIILAPLGDIQWAGHKDQIAYSALQEYIAEAIERKAWFVGMGDYVDFASPSNRQRLQAAALYDTANQVISDKARDLVDELYDDLLKPTRGRWLGLLEGHHWSHLLTGETTDQYLCSKLLAPFLGTSAYIGLVFDMPAGMRTVTIWATHGAGGGQKVHAPVLKLENMATSWDADIMLVGHMTKRAVGVVERCYPEWGTKGGAAIRHRTMHLVGCGGWLKGYQHGSRQGNTPRGGYVEQKMLTPVALGAPFIRIRPHVRRVDRLKSGGKDERFWEPDIRVET